MLNVSAYYAIRHLTAMNNYAAVSSLFYCTLIVTSECFEYIYIYVCVCMCVRVFVCCVIE